MNRTVYFNATVLACTFVSRSLLFALSHMLPLNFFLSLSIARANMRSVPLFNKVYPSL